MAQKYLLHELLQDDQEPFLLKNYIADRKFQITKAPPKNQLQLRQRKPISQNSNFPSNFCKNACFFSFHGSPDHRRSPLVDLQSSPKSPCKNHNAIFLHIPSTLIEAALRIQNQSSKTKPLSRNSAFGLFGSFIKRLTNRSRNRKCGIAAEGARVSVNDILTWDSSVGWKKAEEKHRKKASGKSSSGEVSACERGFTCSSNGRPSSAVWSETNEEKSLDLSTSASSQSEDFESMEHFVSTAFAFWENRFCDSPFHFVLQGSPSAGGHKAAVFSSPAASPNRHKKEDKGNNEAEGLKKLELEEEKEQNSPVSVLDPPFEDDNYGHVDADVDNDFDLECSYPIVQRTKLQLLQKLRRFEKLAELDPVELEKRMLEQEQDEYDDDDDDCDNELMIEHGQSVSSEEAMNFDGLIKEVLKQIPEGIKKLVIDLIAEENREQNCCFERESIIKSVVNRLETWKLVESNTIDMMVEQDLRREVEAWNGNQQQLEEVTMEIEFAIFGLLIEELSEEVSWDLTVKV